MCGCFTVQLTGGEIHDLYDARQPAQSLDLPLRCNGVPSQEFAAYRLDESGRRVTTRLRWGLIPFWVNYAGIGTRMINARAETVRDKPPCWAPFRSRRSLVLASDWFEGQSARGARRPWYIAPEDGPPLSFAALWIIVLNLMRSMQDGTTERRSTNRKPRMIRRFQTIQTFRFCTDALTEALERCGRPEIFNTDQGSQFTSLEFTSVLNDSGVAVSMDGRGRCTDHIFIERLWRSLKYEAVYLHELSDGLRAQKVISRWMAFYNSRRPHSALGGSTPAEAYDRELPAEYAKPPSGSSPSLPVPTQHQDGLNRNLAA